MMLANRQPMLLWWGAEYTCIYNDAYTPVLGTKHPWALGQPVREVWSEIWTVLQPLIDTPFHGGPATWMDDIELEINRHGYFEETHFTVAYSPVPDDTAPTGIGGVLATVTEITAKVIAERRVAALRDVGARLAGATTADAVCAIAADTLASYALDVPFAQLYLLDDAGRARLAGSAGITGDVPAWPRAEPIVDLTALSIRAPGPWPDPPAQAIVEPIPAATGPAGFLVAGISARLRLDDDYREFHRLACTQIGAAIARVRAYDEERRRAEALAALDRAKTVFFSNVSHELRTPLTLMTAPLADALAEPDLSPAQRERLELVQRGGTRMHKLVDTLLDFARIEAGRSSTVLAPTDVAALTEDLASSVRSAIERTGVQLVVACEPVGAMQIDPAMWE